MQEIFFPFEEKKSSDPKSRGKKKKDCDDAYIAIKVEIVIHTICTLTVSLLHKTKHKRYFPTQTLSCLFELSAFSLNGHEEDTAVFY